MLLDTCFPRDAANARVHELNGASLRLSWSLMMTCVMLTWHGVAARLAASHCALLTCADAPRLFARVRAGAAAGRALRALGITILAVGLIVYYGRRPD